MAFSHWLEASIPEPVTVLAVPLRPFSLGHYLLMKRLGCPYADDDLKRVRSMEELEQATADLMFAISICAHTYEDFQEFLSDPVSYERWLEEWQLYIEEMRKAPLFNMFEQFATFDKYLRDAMKVPGFWNLEESESSGGGALHWSQTLLQVLLGMGFEEKEVYNMPLGKAFYLYCQELAKNGVIEFMSEEDLAPA